MEIFKIIETNKYFIYWIVWGIVITFFDNDKVNLRTWVKLFVFGILNDFTRRILVGYKWLWGRVDILNENQLMVASVSLSVFIYFLLIYVSEKANRDKIIEAIISKFTK